MIVELTKTADVVGRHAQQHLARGHDAPGRPFGIQTVTLQMGGRFFDIEDFLYRLENYVRFQNTTFSVTGRLIQVTNVTLSGGSDDARPHRARRR